MVNDLRELMSTTTASPPPDTFELGSVLRDGRRRVRRRRLAVLAGTAAATATIAVGASVVPFGGPADLDAAGVPRAEGPTLRLADAVAAKAGSDYRVLATHANENLDRDNGQYFDGVTDDGLVLFRDGPRANQLYPRFALLDPASSEKHWLPDPQIGQTQTWPLELSEERIVLLGLAGGGMKSRLVAHVFDRAAREWTTVSWPGLAKVDGPDAAVMGPDDRLYVRVPETQGRIPEGGWPVGPDGEADDADAEGDTFHLWSASLTDPDDVRDEQLIVGAVDFGATTMTWTDSSGGEAGEVHVRDLETGEERSFDPRTGEKCNLLSFGATDDHVVMGQYCGTYEDGVRDDRVQVLTTDGEQVATLQDSGVEGWLASDGLATITSYGDAGGTYLYELATGRFLWVSDSVSSWSSGGPAPAGMFLWNTPVNRNHGMTEHLGELLD